MNLNAFTHTCNNLTKAMSGAFFAAYLAFTSFQLNAQVSITGPGFSYEDNFTDFDGLADPTNWSTVGGNWQGENGGTSTSGGKYSYGQDDLFGFYDGSIGYLPSGSVSSCTAEISFENNSGSTIPDLNIGYIAEQWRSANGGRVNGWAVSYAINGGTPVPVPALNFVASNSNTTGGGLVGITPLITTLSGINLANGDEITIRFSGDRGTGSGSSQGVAIDNFFLEVPEETGGPCSISIDNIEITDCRIVDEGVELFDIDFTISYENPDDSEILFSLFAASGGLDDFPLGIDTLPNPFVFTVTDVALTFSNNVSVVFGGESGCSDNTVIFDPICESGAEGDCEEVFISEYVEGSSFNKAIEIFNPTTGGIDLGNGDYLLEFYFNGNTTPATSIPLSGILPAGSTFVIIPENANDLDLIQSANIISDQTSWFNGNDAVVLKVGGAMGSIIDAIGQIGDDTNFAQDVTLRRQSGVAQGDTDASDTFTAADEWDSFSNNDFSELGFHDNDCLDEAFCPILDVVINCDRGFIPFDERGQQPPFPGESCFVCDDNGTVTPDDDFFTFSVDVIYDELPETGFLVLTIGTQQYSVPVSELDEPESESIEIYTFEDLELPADGSEFFVSATFTDVQGCTVDAFGCGGFNLRDEYSFGCFAPEACSELEACELPFFSEYLEGSGNNKCLEIYNPTNQIIDLAAEGYRVEFYFNGSINSGLTINLTGQIGPYDTYVICNSGTELTIRDFADQIAGGGWFNGNDAILLVSDIGTLDAIGEVGNSATYAENVTLVRNSNILAGDPEASDAFDPADEWTSFDINTFNGLRFHRSECAPIVRGLVPVDVTQQGGGCDGSFVGSDDPLELEIGSSCWGDMIGREASMYVTDHCGDFDISAKVEVDAFGFAGIMARESLNPESRYVYMFVRNNGQISWGIRGNINGQPNLQIKPQQGRQYMRMTRTGNVFRGYLSRNGVSWQLVFQSGVNLNECLYAGFATHSHCTGCPISSSYTEIQENIGFSPGLQSTVSRSGASEEEIMETAVGDVSVYPNPVHNELNIQLPSLVGEGTHVQILDLNGRVIGAERVDHGDYLRVDLGKYRMAEGMYILNIYHEGEMITKRFVKTTTR